VSVADDRSVLDALPDALAVVTDQAEARLALTEGDTASDQARVARELAEARQHLEAARARLANPDFTGRAPVAVVEGVRQRERELAERVARLTGHVGGPA
jgi:valyl-tRNA synthetase